MTARVSIVPSVRQPRSRSAWLALLFLGASFGLQLTLGSATTSGVTNQFQYDALGRLTNVLDLRLTTANKNTAYGYDTVGNLAWVNLRPNGVTNWHRYDPQNRLTNLVWALNGSLRS